MTENGSDDFNRLYERLVVRRTKKKRATLELTTVNNTPNKKAGALKKVSEAAKLEETRRKEQHEHDMRIVRTVNRLRLARNLRGLARSSRCSPHRLAFQLVASTEQNDLSLLQQYKRNQRQYSRFVQRRKRSASGIEKRMRLERVAARLYLDQAVHFRPDAATTLEGQHRVIDEILFFLPPNASLFSRIGYAESSNVVPAPPLRRK
ncbi:unnamed protein product [Peronospora belbahrii]|uniref:Uncharacterized protein n=1 Tax=Peronospora belbahrii TaxID=622444 RepID=A0AAU9L0N4_9STRA|nr:unnamed protein product [Peronospora belbahrii]CAH0515354.1 unnamed protein product [Peronospora belbahrii]